MPDRPEVSVVVIAYNDASRLPRAVGSVLDQSLAGHEVVIVDDASTDGTGQVADRLAAEHPGRVTAVHHDENSGGCGRPRNTGVEAARGRYVMFLDSDDVLDRHACLNMVVTAEETGADLVSGLCVRSHAGPPAGEFPWYRWLYRDRAVYESLREHPTLIYDTLSTNKCYRRDFLLERGLRFTESLHYEDLLFSAEAYLAASRIAVIPHRVYTWHVDPAAERLSISNRRRELRNLSDRLEIHRRIDRLIAADGTGSEELRLIKDAKFVNHDLPLTLRDLAGAGDDFREGFLELVRPYVAGLHPQALDAANRLPAIAAYLLGQGDINGAMAAAEASRRKRNPPLHAGVVERDGRIYWSGKHLDAADDRGRQILDITSLGLHARPLSRLRPLVTVTELTAGSRVRVSGRIADPLGRIPADAPPKGAALMLRDRRHPSRALHIPVQVEKDGSAGDGFAWRAEFDPRSRLRPLGFVDPLWDAHLELRANGERFATRIAADEEVSVQSLNGTAIPVRPKLSRLAGSSLKVYVTERGNLSFVLDGTGPLAESARAMARRMARITLARRAWRGARILRRVVLRARSSARRALTGRKTKLTVTNRILTRLPIRRGTVVFESHLGKQYSDNPKYIYRELRRSKPQVKAYWSYEGSPEGFPSDATLLKRGSWAYFYALARAEFWIDNQGFPEGLRKREDTTYIQTWHGTAYKRMGFDQPELKNASRGEQAKFREMVGRYDSFLIRTGHDERTLARGMGVTAELLPAGYPRNDPLVNGPDGDPDVARELEKLRRRLGLGGDGRKVVLYAPTFRPDDDRKPRKGRRRPKDATELPFDPERFVTELGDEHVLLIRPHYLSRIVLPPGSSRAAREAVRDVGGVPDITPLMLLTDVLITDRSSVMFDYALLDRPMIFYFPEGVAEEDGYFDLAAEAPGPLVRDEDALFAALADLDGVQRDHAERRRAFAARYGEHDRGTAARTVVERFFERGASHG
jgi:CDP-glycerol glycerophosphotransferase